MTFWDTVERGEYVMIALAVIFILIICIWWIRSEKLGRYNRSYPIFLQRLRDLVVEGDIENAKQLCKAATTPGSLAIGAGLNSMGKQMDEVKSAIENVSKIEKEKMGKGALWLRCLAVISPLIGLGGTLVGIIDRLEYLSEFNESVEISTVCGAIAPTLVTTVAGLGIGIFSLIALTCLESRISSSKRKLDEMELEFINLLNEPS